MTEQRSLTASEAARLLGVAVTTLRTWDRRYGLGPPGHESGRHRRYDPEDVRRLTEMQQLIAQGVPPAQAAAWILGRSAPPATRDGGGHAVAVGTAGPAVRGLTRAAIRLDTVHLRQVIGGALDEHGVVAAWTQLLAPALIHIGEKHAATQELVEVEHLVSGEISAALAAVPRPASAPRTLLACADEEQHTLAIEALAAALAERDIGSRLLGARVPPPALRVALRRAGPDVLVLWSQTPDTADATQLDLVATSRPAPKLTLAAGPGWADVHLRHGELRPVDLADAVHLIAG